MTKKIYFAGAIRGGRADQSLYFEIVRLLNEYGQVLTEHVGDIQLDALGEAGDDKMIHDRDLSWLKEAACLVAEVTTPSLGVGYEIGKATEWGKPVLCLFRPRDGVALSAMIGGGSGISVQEYQSLVDLEKIFDDFFNDRESTR